MSEPTVNVDPVELTLEADTIAREAAAAAAKTAAELPPTPEAAAAAASSEAAAVQVENAAEGYKLISLAIVSQGSELWFPAWQITTNEKTDLSDAIVQALMLWFPDGLLPAKYMALLVIASVGAKITAARYDATTGRLQARYAQPTTKPAPAGAAVDPLNGAGYGPH